MRIWYYVVRTQTNTAFCVAERENRKRKSNIKNKHSGFSGSLGFVLAAAGSAVGVGNLWRFPYLAAKDGGGLFLLIYLVLVVTIGFTLLTSDIAIGRKTKKSAIGAYTELAPKWKFLGILTFFVPVLIMTYYAVIGGWITKYGVVYLTGQASAAAPCPISPRPGKTPAVRCNFTILISFLPQIWYAKLSRV